MDKGFLENTMKKAGYNFQFDQGIKTLADLTVYEKLERQDFINFSGWIDLLKSTKVFVCLRTSHVFQGVLLYVVTIDDKLMFVFKTNSKIINVPWDSIGSINIEEVKEEEKNNDIYS